MKQIFILLSLFLLQSCDPDGFGYKYKKNPVFVIKEAWNAVVETNPDLFRKFTGKEAFCVYGNNEGIDYLQRNLEIDLKDVSIQRDKIQSFNKYSKVPLFFNNYWSYYQERYVIDILQKTTSTELVKLVVECHFGCEEKSEDCLNLKATKYEKKECRIIKLVPFKFSPLPLSKECELLKVNL